MPSQVNPCDTFDNQGFTTLILLMILSSQKFSLLMILSVTWQYFLMSRMSTPPEGKIDELDCCSIRVTASSPFP